MRQKRKSLWSKGFGNIGASIGLALMIQQAFARYCRHKIFVQMAKQRIWTAARKESAFFA